MRRTLKLAGVAGSLLWIAVILVNPDGEEHEVLRSRVWSVAFLGMLLGFCGLFAELRPSLTKVTRVAFVGMIIGLGLMTAGTVVEYWILFGLPHQGGAGGAARGLSWMTVLLGALLLSGCSVVTGILLLRAPVAPRWLGFLFVAFVPSTVVLALVHRVGAALPIACLSSVGFLLDHGGRASPDRHPPDPAPS